MDAIILRDLRVETLIGIHKRERHVTQTVSIDLDIGLPGTTVFTVLFYGFGVEAACVLAMSVLLVWRHKENIRRLLRGEESRVGAKPSAEPPAPSAGER